MAGFNYEAGRSNNMVAAEERGMTTIGRWAKRFKVSAAAAVEVMMPGEAHHTGTGRRGKSRLTPVIDGDCEPTAEQLVAMQAFDRQAKQTKAAPPKLLAASAVARWNTWPTSRGARRIPTEHVEAVADVLLYETGKITWRRLRDVFRPPTADEQAAYQSRTATGLTAPNVRTGEREPAETVFTGIERLSGLVIANEGGLLYHANCNLAYDRPEAIAVRICR